MEVEEKKGVSGVSVWSKFKGYEIPGSTRVPVEEFSVFLGELKGKKILDVGSGSGRSSLIIAQSGADVISFDLSFEGLKETKYKLELPVFQASAENIPIKSETFDGINLCGVLTNLTDKNLDKAKALRKKVITELYRCLKEGGYLIISDFCADHYLTNYPVDYRRHALITGEVGTIAVFEPSKKITFKGLTDKQVKELGESTHLVRFAHHYMPEELVNLLKEAGFKVLKYSVEIGKTPSGNEIENIVLVARKI